MKYVVQKVQHGPGCSDSCIQYTVYSILYNQINIHNMEIANV